MSTDGDPSDFFIPDGLDKPTRYKIQRIREYPDLVPDEPGCIGIYVDEEICFVDWSSSMRERVKANLIGAGIDELLELPDAMLSPHLTALSREPDFDVHGWLSRARLYWLAVESRPKYQPPPPPQHRKLEAARQWLEGNSDSLRIARARIALTLWVGAIVLAIGAAGYFGVKHLPELAAENTPASAETEPPAAADTPLSAAEEPQPYEDSYTSSDCEPSADEYGDEVWGEGFENESDCLQSEWEYREGEGWSAFVDAFDSATTEGCESLFALTEDGMLYSDDYEFSDSDCSSISPASAEDVAPSYLPDDAESEGASLGFEAGCDAIFEWMEYEVVYWGNDAYSVEDCYAESFY